MSGAIVGVDPVSTLDGGAGSDGRHRRFGAGGWERAATRIDKIRLGSACMRSILGRPYKNHGLDWPFGY